MVFVDNMPENTSVEWLRRAISSFGKVGDTFIPQSTGKEKGGALVSFALEREE